MSLKWSNKMPKEFVPCTIAMPQQKRIETLKVMKPFSFKCVESGTFKRRKGLIENRSYSKATAVGDSIFWIVCFFVSNRKKRGISSGRKYVVCVFHSTHLFVTYEMRVLVCVFVCISRFYSNHQVSLSSSRSQNTTNFLCRIRFNEIEYFFPLRKVQMCNLLEDAVVRSAHISYVYVYIRIYLDLNMKKKNGIKGFSKASRE